MTPDRQSGPDLHLQPAAADPAISASGWLLPGGDPVRWLAWLAQAAPDAAAALRLAVLPRAARDPRPGALLVLDPGHVIGADTAGAIPCQRRGRAVHLPLHARLWPPVADDELDELFDDAVVAWHPALGPVGFAAGDLLRVADLLAAPEVSGGHWGDAHPGELPARLVAVVAPPPPDVREMLAGGGDGIGGKPPSGLQPDGREPGLLARGAGFAAHGLGWTMQRAAGLGQALLGGAAAAAGRGGSRGGMPGGPAGAAGDPWLAQLRRWAERFMADHDPRLHDARHRELERLMRELERDPDNGLRFALPLAGSGDDLHRGLAAPGWRLGERDLTALGGGGGGPRDGWGVDPRMQASLRARYLELAQREVALGRHRRAAYIHAVLLGDLHSAAAVLEAGRHYREAAAILRDRLKQPLRAARCLEQGGLLDEAAALYEAEGAWGEAAGCHQRLGREDDARRCWRAEVERLVQRHDAVAAAALLADRLADHDAALALLAGTWPAHPQAGPALLAGFDLLARLGRHRAAADLARTVADHDPPDLRALDGLIHLAATYPDADLRRTATDDGRVLVGRALALADPSGGGVPAVAGPLLRRLHALAPADRVLVADAARWPRLAASRPAARPVPRVPAVTPAAFTLPPAVLRPGVVWVAAARSSDLGVVLVGWQGGALVADWVARGGEHGNLIRPDADDLRRPRGLVRLFAVAGGAEERFYLRIARPADGDQTPVWAPVEIHRRPAVDGWQRPLSIGTFGPLFGTIAACAPAHDGGWWMLSAGNDGWSAVHAATHGPLTKVPLPDIPPGTPHLSPLGDGVMVAIGSQVAATGGTISGLLGAALDGEVRELLPHPDPAQPVLIALTTSGVTAVWLNRAGAGLSTVRFAGDATPRLRATFTPGGTLVLADERQHRAYRCHDGHVELLAEAPGTGAVPLLLVATGEREVHLLLDDGTAKSWRWEMPRG